MSELTKQLRIKAGMINLGERIAWGSETALMETAANRIDHLEAELAKLRAGQEPVRFWFIGDAGQQKGATYCKKSSRDGSLAFFECEKDAKRAALRHPGTEVYPVEYYRKPQATPQPSAAPDGSGLDADDVRAACQNAIEVFADEENAEQCREVAEYMREVLLADLYRAAQQPSSRARQEGGRHES